MPYTTIIRGGLVVDGTGTPARRADVGITDGRITDIGDLSGAQAARTIDAEGALVTPGFVDLHTHYDGQISWDPDLMPSSIHGVTTVVMGSCGVGFAPCRAEHRDALVALMEGVEDIPGSALAEGIDWQWESFAQYMDALDAKPHTLDFALQVPHDCLRVYAMGERGLHGAPATDDDIAAMRAELRAALEAGAMGFSTGRSDNHRNRSGAPTPASEADARELTGLGAAFRGLNHGVVQAVSDFDLAQGPDRFDAEYDLIEAMADAAGPEHPFSISLSQRDQEPNQWRRIIARAEKATARGRATRLQVAPRGIGVMLGLEATFHPFMGFPSYKAIAHLPLAERVAAMRDPAFRARLITEKSDKVAGDGSSLPPLADFLLSMIDRVAFRFFRLGERPNYEPGMADSVGAQAQRQGIPVLAAILDALLENDGHELLYFPVYNYAGFDLEAVREMLTHPLALPGLSDGGAHVGTICDASFSTFLLTHWARDRAKGRLPVERVVRFLSHDTAAFLGLRDRGVLAPGLRADVNIIDHTALSLSRPRLVRDLPAGGQRLLQDAAGYRATLVAGEVITENGRLTGARPGRLVRAGRA
jgi:N-acyl-D-aspartate/D-glutamate deacylase